MKAMMAVVRQRAKLKSILSKQFSKLHLLFNSLVKDCGKVFQAVHLLIIAKLFNAISKRVMIDAEEGDFTWKQETQNSQS